MLMLFGFEWNIVSSAQPYGSMIGRSLIVRPGLVQNGPNSTLASGLDDLTLRLVPKGWYLSAGGSIEHHSSTKTKLPSSRPPISGAAELGTAPFRLPLNWGATLIRPCEI